MKKIAFVGPESTGKSTLAKRLSEIYEDEYVPEFAREYVQQLNKKYTIEDIEIISKGQLELEQKTTLKAREYLFCDTTLLVSKIWAKDAFDTSIQFVEENYHPNDYVIHFLCDIDSPWVADPLREHPLPEQRLYFFNWYKRELENSNAIFLIVTGTIEERISICKDAISKL